MSPWARRMLSRSARAQHLLGLVIQGKTGSQRQNMHVPELGVTPWAEHCHSLRGKGVGLLGVAGRRVSYITGRSRNMERRTEGFPCSKTNLKLPSGLKSPKMTPSNAGKHVEQQELSFIAVEIQNDTTTLGDHLTVFMTANIVLLYYSATELLPLLKWDENISTQKPVYECL